MSSLSVLRRVVYFAKGGLHLLLDEVLKGFLDRKANSILNSWDVLGASIPPCATGNLVVGEAFTLVVAGGCKAF